MGNPCKKNCNECEDTFNLYYCEICEDYPDDSRCQECHQEIEHNRLNAGVTIGSGGGSNIRIEIPDQENTEPITPVGKPFTWKSWVTWNPFED